MGKAIYNAIAGITLTKDVDRITLTLNGRNALSAATANQLHEEVIKANYILHNPDWEKALAKAEDHFNADGQLWFLLKLCNQDELGKFQNMFSVAKEIFDEKKQLLISSDLFEKALLAQPSDQDHLNSMGKYTAATKRLVGKEFSKHISHVFENSSEPKKQE